MLNEIKNLIKEQKIADEEASFIVESSNEPFDLDYLFLEDEEIHEDTEVIEEADEKDDMDDSDDPEIDLDDTGVDLDKMDEDDGDIEIDDSEFEDSDEAASAEEEYDDDPEIDFNDEPSSDADESVSDSSDTVDEDPSIDNGGDMTPLSAAATQSSGLDGVDDYNFELDDDVRGIVTSVDMNVVSNTTSNRLPVPPPGASSAILSDEMDVRPEQGFAGNPDTMTLADNSEEPPSEAMMAGPTTGEDDPEIDENSLSVPPEEPIEEEYIIDNIDEFEMFNEAKGKKDSVGAKITAPLKKLFKKTSDDAKKIDINEYKAAKSASKAVAGNEPVEKKSKKDDKEDTAKSSGKKRKSIGDLVTAKTSDDDGVSKKSLKQESVTAFKQGPSSMFASLFQEDNRPIAAPAQPEAAAPQPTGTDAQQPAAAAPAAVDPNAAVQADPSIPDVPGGDPTADAAVAGDPGVAPDENMQVNDVTSAVQDKVAEAQGDIQNDAAGIEEIPEDPEVDEAIDTETPGGDVVGSDAAADSEKTAELASIAKTAGELTTKLSGLVAQTAAKTAGVSDSTDDMAVAEDMSDPVI